MRNRRRYMYFVSSPAILHRAHYAMDSYFANLRVPSIAHVIASIARDDDQVSIPENCKDRSAENVRHCVPMLPCAVPG